MQSIIDDKHQMEHLTILKKKTEQNLNELKKTDNEKIDKIVMEAKLNLDRRISKDQ